jgi:hypothetical protein
MTSSAAAPHTGQRCLSRREGSVIVSLQAGTARGWGTDSLTDLENIVGSNFNDTLTGDAGEKQIWGGIRGSSSGADTTGTRDAQFLAFNLNTTLVLSRVLESVNSLNRRDGCSVD